jgi:hypothetical protein
LAQISFRASAAEQDQFPSAKLRAAGRKKLPLSNPPAFMVKPGHET